MEEKVNGIPRDAGDGASRAFPRQGQDASFDEGSVSRCGGPQRFGRIRPVPMLCAGAG